VSPSGTTFGQSPATAHAAVQGDSVQHYSAPYPLPVRRNQTSELQAARSEAGRVASSSCDECNNTHTRTVLPRLKQIDRQNKMSTYIMTGP